MLVSICDLGDRSLKVDYTLGSIFYHVCKNFNVTNLYSYSIKIVTEEVVGFAKCIIKDVNDLMSYNNVLFTITQCSGWILL